MAKTDSTKQEIYNFVDCFLEEDEDGNIILTNESFQEPISLSLVFRRFLGKQVSFKISGNEVISCETSLHEGNEEE